MMFSTTNTPGEPLTVPSIGQCCHGLGERPVPSYKVFSTTNTPGEPLTVPSIGQSVTGWDHVPYQVTKYTSTKPWVDVSPSLLWDQVVMGWEIALNRTRLQ